MRYLAGFIGGFIISVLLLVFQQHLISGERLVPPEPRPVIMLGSSTKPRPMEYKTYEPRQPPPEPQPHEKPVNAVEPRNAARVEPPRIPLTGLRGLPGDGAYVPGVIGSGGFDGAAAVRTMVAPRYPAEALRDGIEGEVEVEFTVLHDGSVADVRIVRAEPRGMFEQYAKRAILRWQFIPRREGGVAVAMRARQVIEFRLPSEQR